MTDSFWIGVWQALIAAVVTVILGYINSKTRHAVDRQSKTIGKVHVLVNSHMREQLKINAIALRRIADLTGHDKDQRAARTAEQELADHDEKQGIVDGVKDNN